VPMRRRTAPAHSGHSRKGLSDMFWNSSKLCPHFSHSYSYVGMTDVPFQDSDVVDLAAVFAYLSNESFSH